MGRYGRIMDPFCSVVLGDCRVLKHSTYKFTFRKTAADSAPLAVLYSEFAMVCLNVKAKCDAFFEVKTELVGQGLVTELALSKSQKFFQSKKTNYKVA